MGARLINNPRRTKIGHVEAFPVLHMRSLRKSAMFSEGQRTEGHFRYPGASNAITIIVDLRSEHDLKVLLKVGHADSATNMQVVGQRIGRPVSMDMAKRGKSVRRLPAALKAASSHGQGPQSDRLECDRR